MLQIICGYHALPLPQQGSELVFQPLEHLQSIEYRRPPISVLGLYAKYSDLFEVPEVCLLLMIIHRSKLLVIMVTRVYKLIESQC